jgi:putative ABC transport system permease protein
MSLLQDLSYTLNSLRKAPGFSLVVIITLALGIGANTAVFSMIDVLLLRPLPYPDSKHLLKLFETKTANDSTSLSGVSPANFLDWAEQSRALESMAASAGFRYNLTGNEMPEQVWGGAVSAEWFRVLGVRPVLGRDFRPEDDQPSASPTVLLSVGLWRRKYQADASIVGKTIGINGNAFTVIGVMPKKADFRPETELWIPLRKQIRPDRMLWRDARFLDVIARAKRGLTPAQASDDLNRIADSIRAAHPTGDIYGAATILPLQQSLVSDMRGMLMVSLATVALVLLVACANVTNLMLLRVTARTREIAIRLALGARPRNVIRQLVIEGICLGASAGVVGLGFGAAGKKLLLWQLEWNSPDLAAVNLSWPVLFFTFGMSVIAGVIFALVPAMTVVRAEMHDLLRRATSTTTVDVKGRRLRQGFVVAEIACSMVLLAGAGLLVRSFQRLQHVPLGFDTDHRVIVLLSLPRTKYQRDTDVVRFYQQVVEKVRALPGVMDATFTYMVPLNGGGFGVSFQPVGNGVPADQFNDVELRLADSHTLTAFSIPLLRGRFISDFDSIQSEPVCVINRAMAQKYWPNQDPLGQLIVLTRGDVNGENKPRRVVGVAADTLDIINQEPQPQVYVPYAQISFFNMQLLVHTHDSAAAVRKSVSGVLQSVDPDQPIRQVKAFADLVPGALADWRVAITLLGGLAGIAVLLTTLGVFAVISYMVREKTREIGIRMAIGATRRNVFNLVLRQTTWLAIIGVIVGIAISAACTRLLGSLIYGVSFTDPLTFLIVTALLATLALLASYVPARRATRIDPVHTLRAE